MKHCPNISPRFNCIQAFDEAAEALAAEERVKEQLCQELNLLVQQSAHTQLEKLDQLTQRLELLNAGINIAGEPAMRSGCTGTVYSPGSWQLRGGWVREWLGRRWRACAYGACAGPAVCGLGTAGGRRGQGGSWRNLDLSGGGKKGS